MQEKIIILDFGSQTTQLIGRRVRELSMYCEIVPYNKFPADDPSVIGVILSGSPFSVYDEKAFRINVDEIAERYPVLGICYGAQLMAYQAGGSVEPADSREYGRANLTAVDAANPLLKDIPVGSQVWMSHGDTITTLPDTFRIIASTAEVPVAAYQVEGQRRWGVQFHPEVNNSVLAAASTRQWPPCFSTRPSAITSPVSSLTTACSAKMSLPMCSATTNVWASM